MTEQKAKVIAYKERKRKAQAAAHHAIECASPDKIEKALAILNGAA